MGNRHVRLVVQAGTLVLMLAVMTVGACGPDTGAGEDGRSPDALGQASQAASGVGDAGSRMIPQPLIPSDMKVAPEVERVDLTVPTFSNPTRVTNPLFPVSRQDSILMVGHVDGEPFRTEVTLLPQTRIVEWQDQRIETLVSQYTAYLDGRVQEVAYDLYAQADDGSVWYFGEDVADFEDGAILTKEGTWLVGKDGPAAMIMPSNPRVGDVYRTENSPGIAFEEVRVRSIDETLDGPLGPVEGGLVAEEHHMDGSTEDKLFGPGYGEFYTSDGSDVEALALAVPTDALPGPLPEELDTLHGRALGIFDAAKAGNWSVSSVAVHEMTAAWKSYRTGDVPRRIEPLMNHALARLTDAVNERDSERARQAALDVAMWSLDLQLQYRPQSDVDLARMDLWSAQLVLDAAADDTGAVGGDVFTIAYIRDRVLDTLHGADVVRMDTEVQHLQVAVADHDLAAASDAAGRLRHLLDEQRT